MTNVTDPLAARVREALRQLREFPGNIEAEDDPAFTTEQVNYLEKRLFEVRALLDPDEPAHPYPDITLYVHDLLTRHQQIAAIWSVEDVKGIRPHLTDNQAWEVLKEVGRKHDAEYGISWTTLETMADDMFPEPTNE